MLASAIMHFYFIGVTTRQSAMARILPLWAEALAIELDLVGVDLPLDASSAQYQKAVLDIKNDSKALGALITTHKLKLYEHAANLFDEFDALAKYTKEVCAIKMQGHRLFGSAMPDCMANVDSLKSMLDANFWHQHKSDVLCFGAGGAALSIVLSLLCDFESSSPLTTKQIYKPQKIFLVDINQERLQSTHDLLEPLRDGVEIEYICQSKAELNDQLLAGRPIGSLIINATGMGKDRPGSPLTDAAYFPLQSVIWELNYRGERLFLKQAKSQEHSRELYIHDGWLRFLYGWTQTLQLVLQKKFTFEQFEQLVKIAEAFRTN